MRPGKRTKLNIGIRRNGVREEIRGTEVTKGGKEWMLGIEDKKRICVVSGRDGSQEEFRK